MLHHAGDVVIRRNERNQGTEGLQTARYGLEGALVAVAGVGVVTSLLGYADQRVAIDMAAAVIGFAGVLAIRFFHNRP